MKIHFASLVGVDYDMDMMPYWIPYYLKAGFDSYTVVLHREHGDIPEGIQSDFRNAGFKVRCADGPFTIGCARSAHLNNIANGLDDNDIFVTADADEFHANNNGTPIDYREVLSCYDVLHGIHSDRYADTLEPCRMDPFVQYPYEEQYTGEYLKNIDIPFLKNTEPPALWRSKIIAAPAGAVVEFKGSHCMSEIPSNYNIRFGHKVIHFAWREAAVRKLALKSYYSIENLKAVFNDVVPEGFIDKHADTVKFVHPDQNFLDSITQENVGDYVTENK